MKAITAVAMAWLLAPAPAAAQAPPAPARFYTEEAHVVERLTLIDASTIHYTATIEGQIVSEGQRARMS